MFFKIILASFVYDVILKGDVYWLKKIRGFQKPIKKYGMNP